MKRILITVLPLAPLVAPPAADIARKEPHRAFIPPRRVEPPKVVGSTQAIDRFIRARLAGAGVKRGHVHDLQATILHLLGPTTSASPIATLVVTSRSRM